MTMSSVPISLATFLASSAVLATEPLGTPTPYCVTDQESVSRIVRKTRRRRAAGGRCSIYLSQEVGRQVLVDAQRAPLLRNAGQPDRGGNLKLSRCRVRSLQGASPTR